MAYSDREFIPGHYCRDCGWPFTASQKRTVCQVLEACQRRQALPLHERGQGCPYNNRVHPEWRALHSSRTAAETETRVEAHSDMTATAAETRRSGVGGALEVPADSSGPEQRQVFVSHASHDRMAVDRLVDLLAEIGAGRLEVFCTSSPGLGIPSGEDFFSHIRKVMARSSLVVHFITPAFLRSSHCLLELGAAWAQGKAFPLLIPPLTLSDLAGGPLANLQNAALASGDGLDELRDRISGLVGVPTRTAGWASRRRRALLDITDALDAAPAGRKRLAAVGVRGSHLEIWSLREDGAVFHSWWPDDEGRRRWNMPHRFPVPDNVADIAVASAGPSHAEVFAVDGQGTLWRRTWRGSKGWSADWKKFDQRVSAPITACSYRDGHIEVFAQDQQIGTVIHSWRSGSEDWNDWIHLDEGLEVD